MNSIFDLVVQHTKGELRLWLTYTDDQYDRDKLSFSLTVKLGDKTSKSEFKVNYDKSAIDTQFSLITDPLLLCLIGCVGAVTVKPIIECYNRDPKQYIACLKSKGLAISSEAASCAIACLTASP